MIVSELYDGQGLGNQLWNYVVARIIATKKGEQFAILGKEKFKGKEFMALDFGAQPKGGVSPEGGPPTTLPDDITQYYREKRRGLKGHLITDVSGTDPKLLDLPPNTKFDGNCQSTDYLAGYETQIRSWLKVKPTYRQNNPGKNVCVIHMRCGDYMTLKDVFLPTSYYQDAMKAIKKINKRVTFACVTDQAEVAQKLLPGVTIIGSALTSEDDSARAAHHRGGPVGVDFSLLMNAEYLIIPNSSFSWWAAYLNTKAKTIIAPKYWAAYNKSDGYWATADIITDQFTYLDRDGQICSAAQCRTQKKAFEAAHPERFVEVTGTVHAPGVRGSLRRWLSQIRSSISLAARHANEIVAIQSYRQTVKLYDIFTFFDELDLLEIRLNMLTDFVDYFVIVECAETFSGRPKPLVFEQNKARFKKFEKKIIHYVVKNVPTSKTDLRTRLKNKKMSPLDREIITNALTSDNVPKGQLHWLKEFYQKESIKQPLAGLHDDDVCFVSDVDEIWDPQAAVDYRQDDVFKLRQDVYAYYFDNRSNERWAGTLVTKYKNIKNGCLNHLRTVSKTKYVYVKNGGWHFTNMGGADKIRKKLESYGHQEFNNDEIKSQIEEKIRSNQDFVGRKFKFWTDEGGLPGYIKDHKKKYLKYFKAA